MNEEMIIGRNPVIEALRSGRSVNKVVVSDRLNKQAYEELTRYCKHTKVTLQRVPRTKLDQLSKGKHQGVIAHVASYSYVTIEDLFLQAQKQEAPPFFIILDELEDPHNLGSIIRTANAAGAHGIIIPKNRAVGLTATVAKTSAGAVEYVPVARVTNVADTIDELKERHVWVVGTDADGEKDYRTLDGETPIALVIGNEGRGLSRLVKKKCDWTIHLPMIGQVPSLNASVACSLLMYEIYRKRNPFGE